MKIMTKNLKALLGAASAISILFSGTSAHAATVDHSPLLSQSQTAQSSISDMVNAIKNSAGGSINNANAGSAVAEAIAANPGVSPETVAAALNQLNLSTEAMGSAVSSASSALGISQDKVASAMITNAFMTGGKAAANQQIQALRASLGDDVVNKSLENIPTGMLADAGDLQNIEPAAGGVYEG